MITVGYRRAPEHRFPAAYDDAVAALRWVTSSAVHLGIDSERIGVTGDSAGENLAAGVVLAARNDSTLPDLRTQILLYGAFDLANDHPSDTTYAEELFLTKREVDTMVAHYLGPDGQADDPRGAPLLAPNHEGLPRATSLPPSATSSTTKAPPTPARWPPRGFRCTTPSPREPRTASCPPPASIPRRNTPPMTLSTDSSGPCATRGRPEPSARGHNSGGRPGDGNRQPNIAARQSSRHIRHISFGSTVGFSYRLAQWRHRSKESFSNPVRDNTNGVIMTTVPENRDSLTDLVERLRRVEHRQEITTLRTSFHHHLNDQNWASLSGLFTERGVLDYGEYGRSEGRQAIFDYYSILLDKIVEFMPNATRAVLKNLHSAHRIELESTTAASGTCYFQEMIRFNDDSFIHLSVGRFSDRYVLRDGVWLFESVELEHYWVVPNNEGWTWPW